MSVRHNKPPKGVGENFLIFFYFVENNELAGRWVGEVAANGIEEHFNHIEEDRCQFL